MVASVRLPLEQRTDAADSEQCAQRASSVERALIYDNPGVLLVCNSTVLAEENDCFRMIFRSGGSRVETRLFSLESKQTGGMRAVRLRDGRRVFAGATRQQDRVVRRK
jgi:hypothetical protein